MRVDLAKEIIDDLDDISFLGVVGGEALFGMFGKAAEAEELEGNGVHPLKIFIEKERRELDH